MCVYHGKILGSGAVHGKMLDLEFFILFLAPAVGSKPAGPILTSFLIPQRTLHGDLTLCCPILTKFS